MAFERYDHIVSHYDSMWPHLVPGYAASFQVMGEALRARGIRPNTILDVGCGTGAAVTALAPYCSPQAKVHLVDGSNLMLDAAASRFQSHLAELALGTYPHDLSQHPIFAPARYDLVVAAFALHHCDAAAQETMLTLMAQSLLPGGLLLVADEFMPEQANAWDLVAKIRGAQIHEKLSTGIITNEFMQLESSLPKEFLLPFHPMGMMRSEQTLQSLNLRTCWLYQHLGVMVLAAERST